MRVLSEEDLVPDEPLGARTGSIGDDDDLLHHRVLAKRTAELTVSSRGNVNIALFGPWGAGKSSFNALLREELLKQATKTRHITFDAWKNAGSGFQANFLSEMAEQLDVNVKISEQLFQSTSSVRGPLSNLRWSLRRRIVVLSSFFVGIFLGLPLAWTLIQLLLGEKRELPTLFLENVHGFGSMAASGTLIVVALLAIIELSKVTVSRSTPSHVAQFGQLFQEILDTKKRDHFVIFVDELDRCDPNDVMATLEGLRTFLGHPRCVFVVAFDREAVAGIIASQLGRSAPRENVAPYYRTSGEYLDKIFQFQLALPPQPVHTFRRLASSLVRHRGGVWAQLRSHSPELLERVVNILSPMHLASPRRTKVLLNDFAVNARVYEGMNFDWLDRAEEIAVLTVLQTEFPRLAADLEREPALMRFIYRQEVPTRQALADLVKHYSESAEREDEVMPLDEVVGTDKGKVAVQLDQNLQRYLRLLRERNVPEPRADLIMMHSDGSLLAFDDPGVYHALLSAADTPRQDVLNALAEASDHDLGEAIRYLLDQTEKESSDVSDRLLVLVGEIATRISTMEPELARLMSGRLSSSTRHLSISSFEGFAAAAASVYTEEAMQAVLRVAAEQTASGVAKVIGSVLDKIAVEDWAKARNDMLPLVLEYAAEEPDVASAFFIKFSEEAGAGLSLDQVEALADTLTAAAPETAELSDESSVESADSEDQDADDSEVFEAQRQANQEIAAKLTAGWVEMPLGARLRRDLLRVLRSVEDEQGFYELHDKLINRDIARGQRAEANALQLEAIADSPESEMSRWNDGLDSEAPVPATLKYDALLVVIQNIVKSRNERLREDGANTALKIAAVPSEAFDTTELARLIHDDLVNDWEEYSDSRFETQVTLLAMLDSLGGDSSSTEDQRAALYKTATSAAQEENVNVDVLVSAVRAEHPKFAARVASELSATDPWEKTNPGLPTRVILSAQERAASGGVSTAPLPHSAIANSDDRVLSALWITTAPPVAEIKRLANAWALPPESWRRFGINASQEQRGEAWRYLVAKQAITDRLRALSESGQSKTIYEETAIAVREGKTVVARDRAIRVFLTLPVERVAADEVRGMVKVMAQDKKRTELALGVQLLRAYIDVLPESAKRALKSLVSKWAEEGEGHVSKRDLAWLVEEGFATKNSPLIEVVKLFSVRR